MTQPQCRGGGACCRSQEPASGREWMLGIPKRNGRNGFLKQTCRTNLLSAVCYILGTSAAERQPHFQPTKAKSSISTTVHWFAAVTWHNPEHNHCIVTNLGDHNSVTKPSASLHETGFFYLFLQLQRRDGNDATSTKCRAGERTAALGNSSFFWQGVEA